MLVPCASDMQASPLTVHCVSVLPTEAAEPGHAVRALPALSYQRCSWRAGPGLPGAHAPSWQGSMKQTGKADLDLGVV